MMSKRYDERGRDERVGRGGRGERGDVGRGGRGADRPRRHHDDWPPSEADWPFGDPRRGRGPGRGKAERLRASRDELAGSGTAERLRASRDDFGGRGWGRGGPWGGPWGKGFGGPRRARGDVRLAILALLAIEPMHGYQMIQEIAERSQGRWNPSPGSVYPTLQALEDEGLVTATQTEGKRVYALTDQGRQHVEGLGDRAKAPWDLGDPAGNLRQMAEQMRQLGPAFAQIMQTGSPDQQAKALEVLSTARRALYQILADGPAPDAAPTPDSPADADG